MGSAERFWDKVAKGEAKQLDKFADDFNKTVERMAKHLKPTDRVLDFACGSGKFALAIAPKVQSVCGIDFAQGMVDVSTQRAAHLGIDNAEFLHGTIDDPRLKAGSFDVVLACNILHLLDEPEPVLDTIDTLLAPGGRFICATGVLAENKGILTGALWLLSTIGFIPKVRFYHTDRLTDLVGSRFHLIDSTQWTGVFTNLLLVAEKG